MSHLNLPIEYEDWTIPSESIATRGAGDRENIGYVSGPTDTRTFLPRTSNLEAKNYSYFQPFPMTDPRRYCFSNNSQSQDTDASPETRHFQHPARGRGQRWIPPPFHEEWKRQPVQDHSLRQLADAITLAIA